MIEANSRALPAEAMLLHVASKRCAIFLNDGRLMFPARLRLEVRGPPSWQRSSFDRDGWPQLVLVDEHALLGVRSAYDASSDAIFISSQLPQMTRVDPAAVTAVIVDELGHAVDARTNMDDAPGDEGAIFAALVLQRNALKPSSLAALKAESDDGTLSVAGRTLQIEFARHSVGSITLDDSLADWTARTRYSAPSGSGYEHLCRGEGWASSRRAVLVARSRVVTSILSRALLARRTGCQQIDRIL